MDSGATVHEHILVIKVPWSLAVELDLTDEEIVNYCRPYGDSWEMTSLDPRPFTEDMIYVTYKDTHYKS